MRRGSKERIQKFSKKMRRAMGVWGLVPLWDLAAHKWGPEVEAKC